MATDPENPILDQIATLEKHLNSISVEVEELKQYGGRLYHDLLREVDEYYRSQREVLESWATKSREFAEKEFESEVFIDDGTADQEKSECGHRGEQFIRYKFNRLATTLPEASEYFVSKRTPFIESILKVDGIKDDNLNDVPVDIGAHAVEACAVVPVQTVAYTVVKNGLVFGDKKCGPGTRAFLNMSCMPPIAGVIRGITKQKIDFVPDGQAPMSIPLTSLNYHLASITLP